VEVVRQMSGSLINLCIVPSWVRPDERGHLVSDDAVEGSVITGDMIVNAGCSLILAIVGPWECVQANPSIRD
jgi:hypothetical protein